MINNDKRREGVTFGGITNGSVDAESGGK